MLYAQSYYNDNENKNSSPYNSQDSIRMFIKSLVFFCVSINEVEFFRQFPVFFWQFPVFVQCDGDILKMGWINGIKRLVSFVLYVTPQNGPAKKKNDLHMYFNWPPKEIQKARGVDSCLVYRGGLTTVHVDVACI